MTFLLNYHLRIFYIEERAFSRFQIKNDGERYLANGKVSEMFSDVSLKFSSHRPAAKINDLAAVENDKLQYSESGGARCALARGKAIVSPQCQFDPT